jgi:hypothetical protein
LLAGLPVVYGFDVAQFFLAIFCSHDHSRGRISLTQTSFCFLQPKKAEFGLRQTSYYRTSKNSASFKHQESW